MSSSNPRHFITLPRGHRIYLTAGGHSETGNKKSSKTTVAFLFISSLTGHFGLQFSFPAMFIPFLKRFVLFYFYSLKPFYKSEAHPVGPSLLSNSPLYGANPRGMPGGMGGFGNDWYITKKDFQYSQVLLFGNAHASSLGPRR